MTDSLLVQSLLQKLQLWNGTAITDYHPHGPEFLQGLLRCSPQALGPSNEGSHQSLERGDWTVLFSVSWTKPGYALTKKGAFVPRARPEQFGQSFRAPNNVMMDSRMCFYESITGS